MKKNKPCILLILGVMLLCGVNAFAADLKVGVVIDGANAGVNELIEVTEEEIRRLISDTDTISFDDSFLIDGNWNLEKINAAVSVLNREKRVDVILAVGPVSSHVVAGSKKLSKPSFATHIVNGSMQGISNSNGSSGVNNLAYIDMGLNIGRHIDRFRQIKAFNTLHLLVSPYMLDGIPELERFLTTEAGNRGVKLVTVKVDGNIGRLEETLAGAQAVYLAPLISLNPDQRNAVIKKINQLKIPSMNMLGRKAVEDGVFASIAMELDSQKLARRLALNFQRLLLGENPEVFQTSFTSSERLTINMQTAREIGIFPTWEQMTDAVLLHEDNKKVDRQLSITAAIELALARNLKLLAKKQEIDGGNQGVERAKSGLRPHLQAFARQNVMDKDRADSIMSPAQYSAQLGAELQYFIHNEPAQANIDMKRLFQAALREEERALLLDITRDAALAYLNVLKSKSLQAIQRDNLEVTRANLEIARFREQVGMSGPAEVFRWEIQMASARQAVVDVSVMRKKSELALNQLLNAAQEEEFTTVDCDVYPQVFFLDYAKVASYIDNIYGYKIFRDFLVADTFFFSPEIQQLDKSLTALGRGERSARRRFNQPTVAIQGNFSRTFHESGTGRVKPAMPAPFNSVFNYPDKNDWYVGLHVSMPLHQGGDRKASIKEARANIKKLEYDRDHLMQRLELNTRASLEDARASFSGIGLSRTRADFASKALGLVQSAYTRGAVNILDLIDAQNALLIAQEASTNAVFNFLSDFVRVCRAVGTFDFILNQQTNEDWYERLEQYYKVRNVELTPRIASPEREEPAIGNDSEFILYQD